MTEHQLKRNVLIYYLISFFRGILPYIPIWVSYFGGILSFQQMAILQSVRFLVAVLFEIPTGAVSDILGRKISSSFGMFLFAFGSVLTGLASSAFWLISFVMLTELGQVFVSGSMTAWLYDSLKEKGKTDQYLDIRSKSNTVFQIAMIFSMLIGGFSYQVYKGLPYFIQGFAYLLAAISLMLAVEPHIDSEIFSFKNYLKQSKEGFTELFKSKYVMVLSLFYILVSAIVDSSQKFFNQLFAAQVGFDEIARGKLFATIRILNIFLIIALAKLAKQSKSKILLLYPIFFLLIFVPSFWASQSLAAVLLIGLTLGNISRKVILEKFVNDEFSSRVRSTALSSLELLVSLVMVLIIYLSRFALENSNQAAGIISVLGVLAFAISLPMAIWLIKTKSDESFLNKVKRNLLAVRYKFGYRAGEKNLDNL